MMHDVFFNQASAYDGCDSTLLLGRFRLFERQLVEYEKYRTKYMWMFGRLPKPHNNGMAEVLDVRNLLAIPVTWC